MNDDSVADGCPDQRPEQSEMLPLGRNRSLGQEIAARVPDVVRFPIDRANRVVCLLGVCRRIRFAGERRSGRQIETRRGVVPIDILGGDEIFPRDARRWLRCAGLHGRDR